MPRTDATTVKAILGSNYDTVANPDLTYVIRSASVLTDQVAACAVAKGVPLDDPSLLEIETNLAAHFYARQDQLYSSRSTGRASGSFQGQTGMSLNASQYGQTAMLFDPSGCLPAMNKGSVKPARLGWLGKSPQEQTPLDQRGY